MRDDFCFKGKLYGKGAVVEVYEEEKENFKFNSILIFEKYDEANKICHFHSLHDYWEKHIIPVEQLENVIFNVVPAYGSGTKRNSKKIQEKYIEGIVSAWIWYLLIMFLAIFLNGLGNVILTWLTASIVFFSWRHKKMNGE